MPHSIGYLPIAQEDICQWRFFGKHLKIGIMSRTARPPAYSDIQAEIGARIRQVREIYEIDQAELARALEIDASTLNKIEKGTRSPSIFNIISLANRLRVSADFLLRGQLVARMDEELALHLAAKHPNLAPPIRRGKDRGIDFS
ncbi:MAG TPA: helix-turn-helix transcriptional regulator [Rhodopila sp.]|jgi:transcriptional regulator with XRE-family HTH domain|nr:helix-turn-helix transcriptional regulator [Rhodopila sp.]